LTAGTRPAVSVLDGLTHGVTLWNLL
jgi:hypothetical protein